MAGGCQKGLSVPSLTGRVLGRFLADSGKAWQDLADLIDHFNKS